MHYGPLLHLLSLDSAFPYTSERVADFIVDDTKEIVVVNFSIIGRLLLS